MKNSFKDFSGGGPYVKNSVNDMSGAGTYMKNYLKDSVVKDPTTRPTKWLLFYKLL